MRVETTNSKKLEETIQKIAKDGMQSLHVLADFDRTLTKAFVNGKFISSMITILREDGDYLAPEYAPQAHALYHHYGPIENDPKVPLLEKKKIMEEWWQAHFNLLIKYGLSQSDVKKVAESGKLKFRDQFPDFLKILAENDVPLVIMSANPLGGEAIFTLLEKEGLNSENIDVIGNDFIWGNDGKARDVKKPIIHSFNKDETLLQNFPAFDNIKNRTNVLLLGDGLGDIGMAEGFDYKNIIKVGFLSGDESQLPDYVENYDAVILGDGSFEYVNNLIRKIL